MFATQILPISVFLKKKYTNFSFKFKYCFGADFSKKKFYFWVAIAALGCLLFDLILTQVFPILDEWNEMLFGKDDSELSLNFIEVISGCIMAPLVEEAIFRGAIERRLLEKNWNPWIAIVISAIFFAIPHGKIYIFFSFFGILVGWLYYRTGCVWPGIVAHVINNSIAAVMAIGLLISGDELVDDQLLPLGVSIPLLIVGLAMMFFSVRQIAIMTKDRKLATPSTGE